MIPRSSLPALLLIGVLSMLACQFLFPAGPSCRVNMPTTGWKECWDGDDRYYVAVLMASSGGFGKAMVS